MVSAMLWGMSGMRGLSNAVAGLIVLSFLLVAVMPFVVSSVLSSTSVANLVVVGLGEKLRATMPRFNITLTDTGPPVVYRVENLEAGDVRVAVLVVRSNSGDVLVFRPGGCLGGCVVGNVSVYVDLVRDASAKGPEVVLAPGGVFEVRISGGKLLGVATASGGYAPVYASTVAQFAQEAAVAQSLKGTYFTFSNATSLLDLTQNSDVVLTTDLTSDTTNTSILYSGVMQSACYYDYYYSFFSSSYYYDYEVGAFMPYINYTTLSRVYVRNMVVVAGTAIIGGAGGSYAGPTISTSMMVSAYALAPDPANQTEPMVFYLSFPDGESMFCMAAYYGEIATPSSTTSTLTNYGRGFGWRGGRWARAYIAPGNTANGDFLKLCWSNGTLASKAATVIYNMTLSTMKPSTGTSAVETGVLTFDIVMARIDKGTYGYGFYALLENSAEEWIGILYCPAAVTRIIKASSVLNITAGSPETPCKLLVADYSSSPVYNVIDAPYVVVTATDYSYNFTTRTGYIGYYGGNVTVADVSSANIVEKGVLVGTSSNDVYVHRFPYKLKLVNVSVPRDRLSVYYSFINQSLNGTDAFGFYYYNSWMYNTTSIYIRVNEFAGAGGQLAVYWFVPGATGGLDPYFFLADTDGNGLTEMIFITEEIAPGYSGTADDTLPSDGTTAYVWLPGVGFSLLYSSLFVPNYGYASFVDESDYSTPIKYIGCQDWSTTTIYLKFARDFAVNGAQIAQVSVQFRYYFHDSAGDDVDDVENPLNGLFGFYLVDANGTIATSREYIYQELSVYEDTWPPNRNFITDAVYLPVPDEPEVFYVVFGFNDPYGVSQQLGGSGAYNDLEFSVAIEWLGMWLLSR